MKLPGYDNLKPHTTLEWHIANVYRDKQFEESVQQIKDGTKANEDKAVKELAKRYLLTKQEVNYYIRFSENGLLMRFPQSRKAWLSAHEGLVSITFVDSASRAEINEILDSYFDPKHSLDKLLGLPVPKNSKRKPVENPSLIYAIFKQINIHGVEFEKVFEQYIYGRLPDYHGQNAQFPTISKLREYYDSFKPTPPEL